MRGMRAIYGAKVVEVPARMQEVASLVAVLRHSGGVEAGAAAPETVECFCGVDRLASCGCRVSSLMQFSCFVFLINKLLYNLYGLLA